METPEECLLLEDLSQVMIQSNSNTELVDAEGDSTLNTPPPENGDVDGVPLLGLDLVTQCNSSSQEDNSDDGLIPQFMDCIKVLEKENEILVPMVSSHVDKYLKAMLDSESKPELSPPPPELYPDVNMVVDALPSGIVTRLSDTAKQMMEAGFERECCDAYSKWRREFQEQCLSALGLKLQELKIEEFENWIKTCKAAVKIMFPNERRLSNIVFSGFHRAADVSFTEVCMKLTICLVSFADTIITTTTTTTDQSYLLPNFLSSVIPEMSKSLHELNQESLLHGFCKDGILLEADVKKVHERFEIFKAFANLIYINTAQETVAGGGGLHLITQQATNYIDHVCESFGETVREYKIIPGREGKSSFSELLARMIELLESILETKSRDDYTDPALGYVFMMNNLWYIGQEACKWRSLVDGRTILDDHWFQQNTTKVEQNCKLYQRSSWNKMLDILKLEGNESVAPPNVVAESMKDKLNLFNLQFEKIYFFQSTWILSDHKQLREQVINSIDSTLLPAYGKFIDRFQDVLGEHACEYIEYGIVDIQNRLSCLFLLSE